MKSEYPTLLSGNTQYLGATLDKERGGTNFVFYAGKDATNVELCLFDRAEGAHEIRHYNFDASQKEPMLDSEGQTVGYLWHGFAEGVGEGQMYGFRVDGPVEKGYNPNKLLVDPAAKAVTDDLLGWDEAMRINNYDNDALVMPKARVVDWQKLQQQAISEHAPIGRLNVHADTIICEAHVKGATKLHPHVPADERGKYRGLMDEDFIQWMKDMNLTSIELQPIESHGPDYWGYSTMANMAPHTHYATGSHPEVEFMEMVRKLKENGIEVIMDVVPNHTIEGNINGPMVNFRGMDPTLYAPEDASGCGNTRDFGHPFNQRHFIEELKYWRGLGVSGFRIDLASIIGREHGDTFNPDSPVMRAIHNDPELADVKFFGEPWDLKGYFLGSLARINDGQQNHISEWNGSTRDLLSEAAFDTRHDMPRDKLINSLAGSHAQYAFHGAGPQMGMNLVESHDSGTLYDLVSTPDGKHNERNGEGNRDGNDIPREWYWGNEDDRWRVQRFALAMLALSQGSTLITLGHERGHTQDSNTNTWNQDNELTWMKWGDGIPPEGRKLMDFVASANKLRKEHASLRRATYLTGQPDHNTDLQFQGKPMNDVTWLTSQSQILEGHMMQHSDGFGMLLSGDPGNSPDDEKSFVRRVQGRQHENPLLVLVNPTRRDMEFNLPDVTGVKWKPVLNSLGVDKDGSPRAGNEKFNVGWRSVMVFEGQREREISHVMQ